MNKIRYPEFAGSFYPKDTKDLEEMLNYLFEGAARKKVNDTKAILAPHAGYIYSGKIAASSYMQLKEENVKTIILLGPSHHYVFPGAAIWKEGSWMSPLGEIKVDEEVASKLLSLSNHFTDNTIFHEKEHSLEVQIPFIQYLFKDNVKIVPIVFGLPQSDSLISIGKALSLLLANQNIAIVISSDLYHGYSYDEALRHDAYTRELIMKMDAEAFYKAIIEEEAMACGAMGITAFLIATRGHKIEAKFIDYTNSAEVTGDFNGYVVGYLSMAFVKEN